VEPSFQKLFSVEEVNALLPELKKLLDEVRARRDAMREKAPDLQPILEASSSNGGGKKGSEFGVDAYRLHLSVGRITELGVVLKDLDPGLLDFPHSREGRVVFLCWHPPEERVGFWHEIEAGYAGRQPL
jgi:hypothetical protein